MNQFLPPRIGILGAGQLGKMLAIAAAPLHLDLCALGADGRQPAAPYLPHFVAGDYQNYDDVLAFGRSVDVLTIEIEHVNTEALHQLVCEGKTVHPRPGALDIIKDKGVQKQFYEAQGLPTAPFRLWNTAEEVRRALSDGQLTYPFVQKSREAGYDGKGVAVIRSAADLPKLIEAPCLTETLVPFAKELAVIAARRPSGEVRTYPAVEMVFHPTANLVEQLACPASIPEAVEAAAQALAQRTIEALDVCGLLAVEMFLTETGELLINEVAPRPHNSGHQTIDSCPTSQFEQHLRAILDWPLGEIAPYAPSVMVNLLGAPDHTGPAMYEGLADCLRLPGAHLHLYGKAQTRPMRKMGHATVVHTNIETATQLARRIQDTLRIISAAPATNSQS